MKPTPRAWGKYRDLQILEELDTAVVTTLLHAEEVLERLEGAAVVPKVWGL